MSDPLLSAVFSWFLGVLMIPAAQFFSEIVRFKRRVLHSDIRRLKQWLKKHKLEPLETSRMVGLLKRTRYHTRTIEEGEPSQTYHFFFQEENDLEEFKAVMIPALDNHHGGLWTALSAHPRGENLGQEPWLIYLHLLGVKISRGRKSVGRPKSHDQASTTEISASRVIIFDRNLLNTFLESPGNLKEISGYRLSSANQGELFEGEHTGALAELARDAIRNAFEIVAVHTVLQLFSEKISTLYLDKSKVESNRFYDFGIYRLGGVPVVYHPVYLKGVGRRVVREKVFIGSNLLQQSQIQEFETDFDTLFAVRDSIQAGQRKNLNESPASDQEHTYFSDLSSNYFQKVDAYLFEYFERGYIQKIKNVLKDEFGIDPEIFHTLREQLKDLKQYP